MNITIHQTHHQVADFSSLFSFLQNLFEKNVDCKGLHLFPENFLTGYPLKDLCLQKNFIFAYQKFLKNINELSLQFFGQNPKKLSGTTLLLGGLSYSFDKEGLPTQIKNVIYELTPGKKLEVLYTKRLLPNYDIYDERKYFSPGEELKIWEFEGKKILLLICEDMWPSHFYKIDPIKEAKEYCQKKNLHLDLIVNLSASPFHLGKAEKRIDRAQEISHVLGAPMAYVNRVGGEDEILFDGRSFITDEKNILREGKSFEKDELKFKLPSPPKKIIPQKDDPFIQTINTWESFFNPQLNFKSSPAKLEPLNDHQCQTILEAIGFGIQEYAKKCDLHKFIVALSGGMDSSLVLTLMKLFLKKDQSLEALYMPGFYSANLSFDLSQTLCKNLNIPMFQFPIKFLHSTIRNSFQEAFQESLQGPADENIQSRLRGSFLYARSNLTNAMVLNTSNKSELAVGYSTLYGDSVGALSPLGDLYKSEVFTLANYINRKYNNIIPERVITRPPSAELREGQEDAQSLPPYDRLDAILEGFLSYRISQEDLIRHGHNEEEISKVFKLYQKSEFKRFQFCPIIKLKAKSFGFGYRMPLSNKKIN